MIITAIHEIFGNFLKNYYYYLTKFYISDVFPIKDGKNEEDGYLVEDLLFNGIEKIYITDVIYILDILNWDKTLENFKKFFTSKSRKNIIKKGIALNSFDISIECEKLLSNFNIDKKYLIGIRTDIGVECRKRNYNNSKYIKLSKTRCSNDKKYRF